MRRSALLLWASLLLGAITQLGERLLWGAALPLAELARLLAFVAMAYGLSAWVVWELARGRGWARWALSGWFVLSAVAWVMMFDGGLRWQQLADALVLLLDAAALALVWTGAGAAWFRAQRGVDETPASLD